MIRFTYKDAGVDIEAKSEFGATIRAHMRKTFDPRVIDNAGGFAGLFALTSGSRLLQRTYKRPVLVACTDTVGTKLKIAFLMKKHDTVGRDLVAMSVNDLITLGAEPLFFLDCISTGKLNTQQLEELIRGVADGCQEANCALLGGETAEVAGFYSAGIYDVAGFCVGVVERSRVIDGSVVTPGNVIIGIASSGLHSNGYSLVRKVLLEHKKMRVDQHVPELGVTLGEELLRPTRIYARAIRSLVTHYKVKRIPTAIANITGGGMPDNIPRVLPPGCNARIKKGSWPIPPIFDFVQKAGNIDEEEMYHVFNMGIGMVVIVPPYYADAAMEILNRAGERTYPIGEITKGKRGVTIG